MRFPRWGTSHGARCWRLMPLVSVGLCLLVGCGSSGDRSSSSMQLCGPEARTQLLAVRLEPWTPSPAFTIPAGSVAWLQLTRLPFSSEGLFGTAGGVGELHSIPAGAAPNVRVQANGDRESRDPSIVVGKAMTWQRLGLGPASWQVYSASNPGIQVVSCPIG